MLHAPHAKPRTHLLPVVFAIIASALLTACTGGSGSDATGQAGDIPNAFPPVKEDPNGFGEEEAGDTTNVSGLARNEIRVTLQVPPNFAPANAPVARRGLREIADPTLRVFRTGAGLSSQQNMNVSLRSDGTGSIIITFNDFETAPITPDIVVEASFSGGTLRGPAADADRDVKINPFSEYLVRKVIGENITPTQFTALIDCIENSALCVNGLLWPQLVDEIQDFEIDIPADKNIDDLITLLDERADFKEYVDGLTAVIVDSSEVQSISFTDVNANSAVFNSVLFSLELSAAGDGTAGNFAGQWGTRVSEEAGLTNSAGSATTTPSLSFASFALLGFNLTSVANDVPFSRTALRQTAPNSFDPLKSQFDAFLNRNSHSVSPGVASVRSDVFFETGRPLLQTISGKGSALVTGWAPSPFFYRGRLTGGTQTANGRENPTGLLASYVHTAKALRLEATSDGFERKETLEDINLATLELNMLQAAPNTSFNLGTISGKNYNAVSFSVLLSDGMEPVKAMSSLRTWAIPGSITEEFTNNLTMKRNASGSVGAPDASFIPGGSTMHTHGLSLRLAPEKTQLTGWLNIKLDDPGASSCDKVAVAAPCHTAAASRDGQLIALGLNNPTEGRGILLAIETATSTPVLSGTYQLQGLSMGLEADENILTQYSGSTLAFTAATGGVNSAANLTLDPIVTQHTPSTDLVLPPARPGAETAAAMVNVTATGGITIDTGINTIGGNNVTLDGFASKDGELLVLRLLSGNKLGMLLGFKQP